MPQTIAVRSTATLNDFTPVEQHKEFQFVPQVLSLLKSKAWVNKTVFPV